MKYDLSPVNEALDSATIGIKLSGGTGPPRRKLCEQRYRQPMRCGRALRSM